MAEASFIRDIVAEWRIIGDTICNDIGRLPCNLKNPLLLSEKATTSVHLGLNGRYLPRLINHRSYRRKRISKYSRKADLIRRDLYIRGRKHAL